MKKLVLQCRVFSNDDIDKLNQDVNKFFSEHNISTLNIHKIIQTQTETQKFQPSVVISIFYESVEF